MMVGADDGCARRRSRVDVGREGVGVANNPKMGWSCHRVRFPRSRISPGDARVNSHDARLVKIGGVLIAVGAILGIARPTAEFRY